MLQDRVYRHWGYVRKQDRSPCPQRGDILTREQSKVNGAKSRRMTKGRQEGFYEEVLFKQTLKEVREEAMQASGERTCQAEGTALREDCAWDMSCNYDGIHP